MISPFEHPILGRLLEDSVVAALWSAETQIAQYRTFGMAYSRGLGAVGLVEACVAEAAAKHIAALTLSAEDLQAGTVADGLPVPALVRLLRADADGQADAIHNGTTSRDVMDTALALTAQRLSDLLEQLTALSPWVEVVQLAGDQILKAQGAALRMHVAEALGIGVPNHVWHSDRSAIVDCAGLLSLVSGCLGKLGQDVCLMARQGIDEISRQSGGHSSAMPHKSNRIMAELLATLAALNATQLSAMHHALVHEQECSGVAWMLEWMVLPQMAAVTGCALLKARSLVEGITVMGTDAP